MLLCLSLVAFGQLEEKMKKEGVVKGFIYKNGGEIEGYFKKLGTTFSDGNWYDAPWEFQGVVKFIPKDVFEKNEKIKGKFFDKYEAKDCDGYMYEDMYFESVKYADMSAVGMAMLPKKMFMRRISEGKINVFHHYTNPPAVGVYGKGEYEKLLVECAEVHLVYQIGKKGKLKLVNNLNIEKELADCPMVVEKQQKGEYKVIGGEENQSKMNKILNNSLGKEKVRIMAIEDYNKNCN